jgi:hypothetical protein
MVCFRFTRLTTPLLLLYPRSFFKGTKLVPRGFRSAEPGFCQSRRAESGGIKQHG